MSSMRHLWVFIPLCLLALGCAGPKPSTAPPSLATVEDGEHLIENNDYDAARALFADIVKGDPRNARAHYYLGFLLAHFGDNDGAKAHYEQALQCDDTLLVARNNLALLYLEMGEPQRAADELNAVIAADPDDADAWYNLGLAKEDLADPAGAKEAWQRAIALNDSDAAPWLALSALAKKSGQLDEALQFCRSARQADPEDPLAPLQEGQVLFDLKKTSEARSMLLSLVDYAEADAEVLTTGGFLLSRADMDADAITLYRTAIVRDEAFASAHLLMGNALGRLKNCAEAAQHFQRFLELAPAGAEADQARKALTACQP